MASLFYHIHQVAALVMNLRVGGAFATPIFGEGEVIGDH